MGVTSLARSPHGEERLMNEHHLVNGPGRLGRSPAAVLRQRGVLGQRGAPAAVGFPPKAAGALRAPDSPRPDGYQGSPSRACPDAGSRAVSYRTGRRPDPAPTPPTLATQLNNGDIAGRAEARRPQLRLTPAAGPRGGGQPGAGSGRGGARAWLPPQRQRRRRRRAPPRSSLPREVAPAGLPGREREVGGESGGGSGGEGARPTPPPPRPPPRSARGGKLGPAGGRPPPGRPRLRGYWGRSRKP